MAWSAIRGQPVALRILQAHLRHKQVAPAYLFVGPEGVGKRLVARELAKTLNCEQEIEDPCDQCDNCRRMLRDVHPNLHLVAPQAPSNTIRIDEVREVVGNIALRPYMGVCSVVILDGADRLTEEAANALLKALEEPPGQTRFFLITVQPSHVLPTIVSRCQVIRFQRLSVDVIGDLLAQAVPCSPQVATSVSRLAQGSLSRAIELATQWSAYQTLLMQLAQGDYHRWLEWNVAPDRQKLSKWLAASILWLRDVAVTSCGGEGLVSHQDELTSIHQQAQQLNRERCVEVACQCIELLESLEQFVSPRLIGTLLREHWLSLLTEGVT